LFFFFFFLTFIEPHGATHGELNQPSPQFQAGSHLTQETGAVTKMAQVEVRSGRVEAS
jgi:hypothetical protein